MGDEVLGVLSTVDVERFEGNALMMKRFRSWLGCCGLGLGLMGVLPMGVAGTASQTRTAGASVRTLSASEQVQMRHLPEIQVSARLGRPVTLRASLVRALKSWALVSTDLRQPDMGCPPFCWRTSNE